MKKVTIVFGSLLLLAVAYLMGTLIYNTYFVESPPEPDITTNINVMLKRTPDWRRLGIEPVITEDEFAIIDGSTATIPITAELMRQFYDYPDEEINSAKSIFHSQTHQAYVNLVDQEPRMYSKGGEQLPVGLILVTPPSAEEQQEAETKGVTLDMQPVAKDGFVFITHKDNPVDSLTLAQVQDIYSGKITNWKEVGGADEKIIAYQREANSGSQSAMENLVMQGKPLIKPIETQIIMGMGGLIDAVAEYQNGPASIGYTYNYYINNLYRDENIKVLNIDGIKPDKDNIASGAYPLSTNYLVIIRGDAAPDSVERKLRDFLLSEEGQQVVEMAGYVRGR